MPQAALGDWQEMQWFPCSCGLALGFQTAAGRGNYSYLAAGQTEHPSTQDPVLKLREQNRA